MGSLFNVALTIKRNVFIRSVNRVRNLQINTASLMEKSVIGSKTGDCGDLLISFLCALVSFSFFVFQTEAKMLTSHSIANRSQISSLSWL